MAKGGQTYYERGVNPTQKTIHAVMEGREGKTGKEAKAPLFF